MKVLIFILLSFSFYSCSKKTTAKPEMVEYYVKGNPLTIVEGASFDEEFISPSEFKSYFDDGFYISSLNAFVPEGRKTKSTNAEQGNEPTEDFEPIDLNFNYKLTQTQNGYDYVDLNNNDSWKLSFKNNNGSLEIYQLSKLDKSYRISPLHYSIKEDKSAFNILFQVKYKNSYPDLISITFSKDFGGIDDIDSGDKRYNYLFGPGVKIKWREPQKIELNVCGTDAYLLSEKAKEAAKAWNDVTSVVNINVKVKNFYPPFSDLNTNCFYVIDNYIEAEPQFVLGGLAVTKMNVSRGEIQDSDIFVFSDEWEKREMGGILGPSAEKHISSTLTHEIGHLLGLHHQFNGTQSIMSYSKEREKRVISDYDIEAIEFLYR